MISFYLKPAKHACLPATTTFEHRPDFQGDKVGRRRRRSTFIRRRGIRFHWDVNDLTTANGNKSTELGYHSDLINPVQITEIRCRFVCLKMKSNRPKNRVESDAIQTFIIRFPLSIQQFVTRPSELTTDHEMTR